MNSEVKLTRLFYTVTRHIKDVFIKMKTTFVWFCTSVGTDCITLEFCL